MRLADGRCLLTEQSGQRWLMSPHRPSPGAAVPVDEEASLDEDPQRPSRTPASWPSPPRAARASGAPPSIARPRAVVGIVRWAASYAFVGASGTLHEAPSPLGRFTRRIPPPEPLVRVRGAGRTVLAVGATGRLLRLDEEAGWQRVDLGGVHAFDLAVAPTGHAVVLAAPEAVFTSEDGGRRLTRAAAPPIGVQRVAHPAGGPFILEGVAASLTWDPRHPATFTKDRTRIPETEPAVPLQGGSFPSADLVTQGRAALDGDQYWEVDISDDGEWVLHKGRLDGPLTRLPVPVGNTEDGNVVLAARGQHVAFVRIGWGGDGPLVEARISHDAAATFEDPIPFVMSELSPLGVAISVDGATLFTGLCLADGERTSEERAVGRSSPAPARRRSRPARRGAPGPAITPAFSPDGRSAYFLGAHDGDTDPSLALFVSRDAGASFEERKLTLGDGDRRPSRPRTESAVTVSRRTAPSAWSSRPAATLSGTAYVTTNADGRDVHAHELPPDVGDRRRPRRARARHRAPGRRRRTPPRRSASRSTAASRGRPCAVRPRSCRTATTAAATSRAAPPAASSGPTSRASAGAAGGEAPLPFEKVEAVPPRAELRTPIVCEPRPGSTWTRIEHVEDARPLPRRARRGPRPHRLDGHHPRSRRPAPSAS